MTPRPTPDPSALSPQDAWTTLFGDALRARAVLDPGALKQAFRQRVLACHPDRAKQLGRSAAELQAELRRVMRAYELLRRGAPSMVARSVPDPRPPAPAPPLPRRPLALAQLLCHWGWIPAAAVRDSLRWQQEQRPPLGRVAVELGMLRETDRQRVAAGRREAERFGACARRMGVLTSKQVGLALEAQRQRQPKLGRYFVQIRLITDTQLRQALVMLEHHNASLRRPTRGA